MVRNPRYQNSAEEAVFPLPPVFAQYDVEATSQPSPPSCPVPDLRKCHDLKTLYVDCKRQGELGQAKQEHVTETLMKYRRCLHAFANHITRHEDKNYVAMRERIGSPGVNFSTLNQKDPRMDQLVYSQPMPLSSKFG